MDIPDFAASETHLVTKIYSKCGPHANRTNLDWFWQPKPKSVGWRREPEVNIKNFCSVLRGRALVVIGDSLSQGFNETLLSALGSRDPSRIGAGMCGPGKGNHYCYASQIYSCSVYSEPDFVVYGVKMPFQAHVLRMVNSEEHMINKVFRSITKEYQGAVVVANWGAMYVDDNYLHSAMPPILNFFLDDLKNVTFIFRSSNMAHQEGANFTDNVLHEPMPNKFKRNWHWEKFPKQSLLWENELQTRSANHTLERGLNQNHGIYANILPMSQKRPDGHCDNIWDLLHYCIPGPIDMWVLYIYSIIVNIEELITLS